MGLKSFLEDAFRIKVKPNEMEHTSMHLTKDKDDIAYKQAKNAESGSIIDVEAIQKFRTLSSNRYERYNEFEDLLHDATISAAIEMYADDATQYNYRTGKIVWAESDDPQIAKAANRLIDVLCINDNAWTHIYALCAYGDVYFRLYRDGDVSDYSEAINYAKTGQSLVRVKPKDESRKIDEYVEYVDDPATIYDLQVKDKTAGFIKMINVEPSKTATSMSNIYASNTMDISDVNIYNNTSFVHICLSGNIERHPELITLTDSNTGEVTVYKVKTGKSILADAYEASQTVKLLEDSMLLSRITKSALVRLLQIEVGDMPKSEVEALLRRVKNLLEQKMALTTQNGMVSSYNSPGPMENIVYIPTRDGKGVITPNTLGGDVNIKDIVDVDYFNNKKLSALKIPKQYLNYDAPEGLGNGTSLTKLSSRYAHTVMRIQKAYITGITKLLNILFTDKGLDYIDKFTIKMVSPATIEDTERDEQMQAHLDFANSIIDMIDGKTNEKGILEVVKWILNEFLNLSDITEILDKYPAMIDPNNGFDSDGDNGFDVNFSGSVGGGGGAPSMGGDFDSDFEETDIETSEPEIGEEPSMTPES